MSVRLEFDHEFFKGISVQLNNNNTGLEDETLAQRIASTPRIKNAWPVFEYSRPRTKFENVRPNPKTSRVSKRSFGATNGTEFGPHAMMQVGKMHAKGHKGKGVKIAVIDSGVDYKHPALGGCFGKDCLVSFGYDLVGDEYGSGGPPKPDADPMDCGGHGTHVTGIIAAQKNPMGFTGVAPEATMGHYRVFGCSGGTGGDILMKATAMAAEAGANIITASIGASGGWSRDGWSDLMSRLAEKGIVCTVAAGNSGGAGALFPSHTASGTNVLSIAAYDDINTTTLLSTSHVSVDGGNKVQFGYSPGEPNAWNNVTLPVWAGNFDLKKPDDGCKPYPDGTDLSGHVALIRRGTCTFAEKAKNAADKGAKYMLIYNNEPGAFGIGLSDVKEIKAVGMLTPQVGETWIKALEAKKKVSVSMIHPHQAEQIINVESNNKTGGALSGFTSWGPTLEMNVKPQFGGPGGNILSTLPLKFGGYGIASGTSMSTPMIAGVVALVQEARGGKVDPIMMRYLLAGNSKPQLWNTGNGFEKGLAPVAQQGAGLVQAYDSAYGKTILEPSSLSFNDTANIPSSLELKIHNSGNSSAEYKLGHSPAFATYIMGKEGKWPSMFPNEVLTSPVTLSFEPASVKADPGKSVNVKVSLKDPQSLEGKRMPFHSGYITVNGTDGSALSVPYQHMGVAMNSIVTLPSDSSWLTNSTDRELKPLPVGTKFLLPKQGTAKPEDGLPTMMARLALGTPEMKVSVESAASNKTIDLFSLDYMTRGYAGFYWDGQISDDKFAPKGEYKAPFRALRINGNKNDTKHWDVARTVNFSIDYKE